MPATRPPAEPDLLEIPEHRFSPRARGRFVALTIVALLVAVAAVGAGAAVAASPADDVAALHTAPGTGSASPTVSSVVRSLRAAGERGHQVHRPIRRLAAPATSTTTTPTTTSTPSTTTSTTSTTTTTTAAPTTTSVPPTTTAPPATTAPPPPTTTAAPAPAPAPAGGSQSGQATWYRWKAGNCAHNSLPKGTRLTVTNTANGKTAVCTVGDRGAFGPPTIIDLDATVFEQLAPLGAGRINVVIRW